MAAMHGALARLAIAALGALAGLAAPAAAPAQTPAPETYAGDFWTRPRLTGDWGGLRDQMAKRGVTLDVDWLQILQGVISGGREQDAGYLGTFEYTLNLDSQKLGLWPGAFLTAYAMSSYGTSVITDSGALIPVNTAGILPAVAVDEPTTALMKLTFAQFLAPWVGVVVGKFNALEGDNNAFAHDYRTQFSNMGLNFNLTAALAPVSAWGGALVFLPWQGALITASVVDPDGSPTDNGLAHLFENGVVVSSEGRFTIKPFGLVGHQLVGFMWSNQERIALKQDPGNTAELLLFNRFPRLANPGPILRRVIDRFFPERATPPEPLKTKEDTWAVYYNFDQYVWNPGSDPTRGIGVFFRAGVSDGKVNPIKYHFNVGISAKGIVPGRPDDTLGIGWSRVELSDDLIPALRERLGIGLEREDAVELYYNFAVTEWLGVSLDLQIVDPAVKKTANSSGEVKNVDTAVIGGLRVYSRF
jgi:porin